ncbi:hypothetical protein V6N13_093169 [Hibiscus sabdariffa]
MPTVNSSQSMPDYVHSLSVHSTYPVQPDEILDFMWESHRCLGRTSTRNKSVHHLSAACTTLRPPLQTNLSKVRCLVQCRISPSTSRPGRGRH